MKKYRDLIILALAICIMLFTIGSYCPIEHIFGIPCPGCNMFTALYWLFIKGDISTAQYFHPAVFPFLLYVVFVGALFIRYRDRVVSTSLFRIASIVFIVILLGVYVYRMIAIFPNPPMQFNHDALIVKVFHLL